MNPFVFPPLFSMMFIGVMGMIVYLKDRRSMMHITFALFCFSMVLWLIGFCIMYASTDEKTALQFARLGFVGVSFVPPTVLHFVLIFLNKMQNKKLKALLMASYLSGVLGLFLCVTNLIYKGIWTGFWGFYPVAGPLYPLFPLTFIVCFTTGALLLFFEMRKEKDPKRLQQIKYVLFAYVFASPGLVDYIVKYQINVYPFAHVCGDLWVFWMTYAIIKHQLMDIKVIIKRSLVYTILITLITILYFVFVYLVERIFQGIIGYRSTVGSIVSAATIALILIPLKNLIQSFLDKHFFAGSLSQIAEQNVQLREEITKSEKYKTLATLTGGIANEIKNPLTAVKGYSHFLKEKHNDKEFIDKFSHVLESETNRIDQLVKQLTDYSNPAPLAVENTDIIKLLNDTLVMLKSELVEHNITLNKDLESGAEVNLYIDPGQLRQAVLNIIMNAIQAMPNGGELSVGTKRSGEGFEITVRDTGCGIAKADISKIFDPFFTRKEKSTGLGLSIALGIIENHKGKIRVTSEEGKGAEFTIELPLAEVKNR